MEEFDPYSMLIGILASNPDGVLLNENAVAQLPEEGFKINLDQISQNLYLIKLNSDVA